MSCLTLLGPAGAPTRLVCLPHAGASGDVYAAWSGDLAGALEVWGATPAGRRHRSGEPLNVDPGRLVDEVVAEVTTDSRPLVVFGHSMGALIGYELSLALSTQGRPPTALVVSGCPPPHVRTARASRDYSDDELAATLVDWGGTEQQLIEDADLRRLTFPPLRADLTLCDLYRRDHPVALDLPLAVLAGRSDPVAPADQMAGWAAYSNDFRGVTQFRGGHFFVTEQRRRVVDHVADLAMHALTAGRRRHER